MFLFSSLSSFVFWLFFVSFAVSAIVRSLFITSKWVPFFETIVKRQEYAIPDDCSHDAEF